MNSSSEILIIGGGTIGLSLALEMKMRGASSVTVISRDFKEAAIHAAAGMLAPQAERLVGPMLELCLRSRALYPDWISKLEQVAAVSTDYWPCGILAPVYEPISDIPPANSPTAIWLDRDAIHQHQRGLGADVVGGWWYPEDGQVDSRALAKALWAAVRELKIDVREGVTVEALAQQNQRVTCIRTSAGDFQAEHYVLATGAWSNQLLPLPIYPKKGQMLAVRSLPLSTELKPTNSPSAGLQRVLFGPDIYIVPRRHGQIVIGATSEDVGFTPGNTAAGIQALLARAIRLYPQIQYYPIQEFWWGFRPTTPDEWPILGASSCPNLTLAVGHHRNGILLAPITAVLLADLIWQQKTDPLLEHFSASRFFNRQNSQTKPTVVCLASDNSTTIKNSPSMLAYATWQATPARETSSSLSVDTPLIIGARQFNSRLMTGTGKYRSLAEMQQSIIASGCEIVTVAVRRVQTNAPGHEGLAEALDWKKIWMLPNTAGCQTAEEAIRVARLGREMAKILGQEDNNFVKLEVIPDPKYLLPDPIGTLQAAEQLVKEGFTVLPYINADPMLAQRLEEVGCATVMPLGSPIGSGQGIKTVANIQIIIENAKVPVVVDAGIGTPSEAAQAMEMGADAVLINSAIALAKNPVAMAKAMGMATIAGRLAYLAGRIPVKSTASASSPLTGIISQ